MLRTQGWINTATGEIVVVVPNNLDVADIKKTALHEAAGHYGLATEEYIAGLAERDTDLTLAGRATLAICAGS